MVKNEGIVFVEIPVHPCIILFAIVVNGIVSILVLLLALSCGRIWKS